MINSSRTRDFTWLSRCVRFGSLLSSSIAHIAVYKSRHINANGSQRKKYNSSFFRLSLICAFEHFRSCTPLHTRMLLPKARRIEELCGLVKSTAQSAHPLPTMAVNKRLAKRPIPSYVFMRLCVACSYFSMQRGYRSSLPQLSVIPKKKSLQLLSC